MSRSFVAVSSSGAVGAAGDDAEGPRSARVAGESSITTNLPILSKLNYPLWSKRMQLHLEANGLWDAVRADAVERRRDHLALFVIIGAVPESVQLQIDIKDSAKKVWEKLKIMYLGVDRVKRARLQTLRRQFEQMAMGDNEPVIDFTAKLTKIANDIRVTGEDLSEKEVIRKFLRVTPEKFDPVTTSLDQSTNFDELTLEEVIGCLVAYEEMLQDRLLRREEKALLTKASTKKDQEASNRGRGGGRGRGRGRGRGQGRHSQGNGKKPEDGEKPPDKSKLQCYNCDKYGHFAYKCRKEKKEEKSNLSKAE